MVPRWYAELGKSGFDYSQTINGMCLEEPALRCGLFYVRLSGSCNVRLRVVIFAAAYQGALAEWLCSGLQIRGHRFDSGTRLHSVYTNICFKKGLVNLFKLYPTFYPTDYKSHRLTFHPVMR